MLIANKHGVIDIFKELNLYSTTVRCFFVEKGVTLTDTSRIRFGVYKNVMAWVIPDYIIKA